jgi:hypothetical protein
MLLPLLLLGAQLSAQADELNAALTNCLFATAREAHSRGESADRFGATLDSSCRHEEARMRTAAVAVLVKRGTGRVSAEKQVDRVLQTGREAVRRAYSNSTGQ